MKLQLIETFDPNTSFEENSTIIALTPQACYELEKAGVKYSPIEDYYSEEDLFANEEDYNRSQLQWLDDLDEFLQSNIDELGKLSLRLGRLYHYYFRTVLLDPLYLRCYIVSKLFEATKPSKAVIFSTTSEATLSDPSDHATADIQSGFSELKVSSDSLYSRIIPLMCATHGIEFEAVTVATAEPESLRGKETLTNKLKRTLRKYGFLGKISEELYIRMQFVRQYIRNRSLPGRSSQRKLNILILCRGAKIWPGIVIDALKRDHSVYELSGTSILKHTWFRSSRSVQLRAKGDNRPETNGNMWEQTMNRLESSDLIERISRQCQLDVSELIIPPLRRFILRICPNILENYKFLVEYYERNRIDFIIAPYAMLSIELAAMAAAKRKEINTACIVHGDDVFTERPLVHSAELSHFNIFISSNTETMGYYEYLCKTYNMTAHLHISPHRMMNAMNIKQLRETTNSRGTKGKIVFLPTLMVWDYRRLERCHYPDLWYYNFQKTLIEYFATKSEYTFVWKGLPHTEPVPNPIPNFIEDSGFSNIEIATNSFIEHLLTAEAVICDFPSTGLYESALAEVPTISLYHSSFKVRDSAKELFGKMLRSFSDIPEAIGHIEEFLNSDPESYKANLVTGNDGIIDILEKIAEK